VGLTVPAQNKQQDLDTISWPLACCSSIPLAQLLELAMIEFHFPAFQAFAKAKSDENFNH